MKHNNHKEAFTLLELLIGFLIIASSSVIFFQTLSMFRKETAFYSEHFLASAMVEKVLEQCHQETDINPHGISALGLVDQIGAPFESNSYITDGQSVFFQQPKISAEEMPPLHHMLNDNFQLKIVPELKEGFYEIDAGFEWNTIHGKASSNSFCRVLTFSGKKQVESRLILDRAIVEERLVSNLFDNPDTNLSSNLDSIGASELMINTGLVYYTCVSLFGSSDFSEKLQQAASLEQGYSVGSDEFADCTELYFEIARDILHLMTSLKDEEIIKGIRGNLGFLDRIPAEPQYIIVGFIKQNIAYFRKLRRLFLTCALKMAERYEYQINSAPTQREQRALVVRLFNIYRIIYANRKFAEEVISSDTGEQRVKDRYLRFLGLMRTYFAERDPSIERMAAQEQIFIGQNILKDKYFIPRYINELFEEFETLAGISL